MSTFISFPPYCKDLTAKVLLPPLSVTLFLSRNSSPSPKNWETGVRGRLGWGHLPRNSSSGSISSSSGSISSSSGFISCLTWVVLIPLHFCLISLSSLYSSYFYWSFQIQQQSINRFASLLFLLVSLSLSELGVLTSRFFSATSFSPFLQSSFFRSSNWKRFQGTRSVQSVARKN